MQTASSPKNKDEVAYLLLESCLVHISMAPDENDIHSSLVNTSTTAIATVPSTPLPSRDKLPLRQWCQIQINPKHDGSSPINSNDNNENGHALVNDKLQMGEKHHHKNDDCSRCNLVLKMCHSNQNDDDDDNHDKDERFSNPPVHFETTSKTSSLFDGTVADMACCSSCQLRGHKKQQHPQRSSSTTQRDDAALLMGLVMECQTIHHHVEIQQCQMMILSSTERTRQINRKNDTPTKETAITSARNHEQQNYIQQVRVALLITLAIPQLSSFMNDHPQNDDTMGKGPPRILSTAILKKKNGSSETHRQSNKYLPASTELLFALLRSDWNYLDQRMEQLRTIPHQYEHQLKSDTPTISSSSSPSMFPSTMSLEDLYVRLGSASHRHESYHKSTTNENEYHDPRHNEEQEKQNCCFLHLPMDLIQEICTYLRAKSLDALRCSCTEVHESTRHIVPGLRRLQLYKHQIKSLDWMRRRETLELTEESILNSNLEKNNNNGDDHHESYGDETNHIFCHGDLHRAVSGGNSVYLEVRNPSTTSSGVSNGGGTNAATVTRKSIRIDPHTGHESIASFKLKHLRKNEKGECNAFALSRKVARGGLLCDDPGLGKTITVLSLLLQTMGLQTKKQHKHDSKIATNDEDIFDAYWKEEMTHCFRRPALNKLLMTLIRECKQEHDSSYFMYPVDPLRDQCEDYMEVIESPMCFNDILAKIGSDPNYGSSFKEFHLDVALIFWNARAYNPEDHFIYKAATRLDAEFEELVQEFKKKYVKSAKKSFSSSCAKPNSSVAAIFERQKRQRLLESLIPSSSSLLVVPTTLENHWEEQINMHIDFSYCTSKIPIIFHYLPQHARDPSYHAPGCLSMIDVFDLLELKSSKTHCPMIFIDRATKARLPSPSFLAKFHIVITTNQRLSNEWKNGSYEEELKENNNNLYKVRVDRSTHKACPLLKVHWLRLVVDEGHSMGRGSQSNAIRFAAWIEAQRRWAMTGTPTPQTISQNGLSNILGLMRFLQHDFFSPRLDGDKVWHNYIFRSWNEGNLAAFFRLRSILLLLMVRHTKDDIEELSPPKFFKTLSNMSQEEITAYNTLVCAIQSNLVTTGMEGKTSGKQDSLLHRRQAKHAREALRNVRLACSGGTQVVPTLTQKNWNETIELLQMHGVTGVKLRVAENFLHRAVTEQLSGCMCCGMQLSTLMVLPCGDLVCTECMDKQTTPSCPVCSTDFDVDQFQLLQPGIDYTWKWNLEEAKKKEEQESSTRRPTIEDHSGDVEEDQHQLHRDEEGNQGAILGRDDGGPDLADVVALQPAGERRHVRNARPGDGHDCEYDPASIDGKCKLCFAEHEECVLIHAHSKCPVCYRVTEPCPKEESKFYYISNKLEQLLLSNQYQHHRHHTNNILGESNGTLSSPSSVQSITNNLTNYSSTASRILGETVLPKERRPLKVILFSQFRPILNLVGHRLLRRFGHGCIAEYWGYARKEELQKFVRSTSCFVMLLGKDGSEGLDLSFVTHIVFLDEVYDKSLENQVISRAYRMGATGSVEVETLVAQNSVEELMTKLQESLSSRIPTVTKWTTNDDSHYDLLTKNNSNSKSLHQDEEGQHSKDNDSDDDMEQIYSASKSGNTATKEYQSAKLHFLLKHLTLIRHGNNTKNNNLSCNRSATANGVFKSYRPKKRARLVFHDIDKAEDEEPQHEADNLVAPASSSGGSNNNKDNDTEESSSTATLPITNHQEKIVKFEMSP